MQSTQSSTTEMGRRKLPSLPPHSQVPSSSASIGIVGIGVGTYGGYHPASTGAPAPPITAPIYYTPSAPEPKDVSTMCNGGSHLLFDMSTATTSRIPTSTRFYPSQISPKSAQEQHQRVYYRPGSALSYESSRATSPSSMVHPTDPAILPGATYKTAPKTKMITMNGGIPGKVHPPKTSDAMMRVLVKKELREVLARRKEFLEATEIEASHRQYVINRMLNTGLLPEGRMPEVDALPKTIKCGLSAELVKGAKIVPSRRTIISVVPKQDTDTRSFYRSPSPGKKSVGCQCEPSTSRPSYTSYGTATSTYTTHSYILPSTSLKQQLRGEPGPHRKSMETQTEGLSSHDQRRGVPKKKQTWEAISKSENNIDLLESTRRYFDEYDRRLKEATEKLDKKRFGFTENQTAEDIELKQQSVLNELEQRREKISSLIDLR